MCRYISHFFLINTSSAFNVTQDPSSTLSAAEAVRVKLVIELHSQLKNETKTLTTAVSHSQGGILYQRETCFSGPP